MLSHLAASVGSPCMPSHLDSPSYYSLPRHFPVLLLPLCFVSSPSLFLPSYVPSGALLILGGPPTRSGSHHACLISPEGDYLLEHVTTSACHTPFPMASLTPAALDTLLHLLETPPPCSNKKRPHSAYRGLDPSLLPPPVITSPAVSIRGTTVFPSRFHQTFTARLRFPPCWRPPLHPRKRYSFNLMRNPWCAAPPLELSSFYSILVSPYPSLKHYFRPQ